MKKSELVQMIREEIQNMIGSRNESWQRDYERDSDPVRKAKMEKDRRDREEKITNASSTRVRGSNRRPDIRWRQQSDKEHPKGTAQKSTTYQTGSGRFAGKNRKGEIRYFDDMPAAQKFASS